MTRNAVWALSNLCRGKNPAPEFEKVSHKSPTLFSFLDFRGVFTCCVFVASVLDCTISDCRGGIPINRIWANSLGLWEATVGWSNCPNSNATPFHMCLRRNLVASCVHLEERSDRCALRFCWARIVPSSSPWELLTMSEKQLCSYFGVGRSIVSTRVTFGRTLAVNLQYFKINTSKAYGALWQNLPVQQSQHNYKQ